MWRNKNFVRHYASRTLRPAEVILLVRHAGAFSGRVLELGIGAGRVTGYLVELAAAVHGIDVSPAMVDYCRSTYPTGTFTVADLRDMSGFESEHFDAVLGANNVLDVLGDEERVRVLRDLRRILKPGGVLAMSAHNRAHIPYLRKPTDLRGARNLLRAAGKLALIPLRVRNRRRLLPFERSEADYALVNDDAHDYTLLHYYISRDSQVRQLDQQGFQPLECLDAEGRLVDVGQEASESAELHYVARRGAGGGDGRSAPAA